MKEPDRSLWGYVGRFTVAHVIIYTLMATVFLIVQNTLPTSTQVALETFTPYRPVGLFATSGEVIRSVILALVLYPFYETIVRAERGWLVLFAALWGVALVGSVQPMPGSIEGVIYTEIPVLGHIVVLVAGAIEVFAFSWLFLWWERRSNVETSYIVERRSAS